MKLSAQLKLGIFAGPFDWYGPASLSVTGPARPAEPPVRIAVASMLSKYLREALMSRFNAFWKGHLPTVEPTAGYHTDGLRFLTDINDKRLELGIADEQLIRAR